jgi:hypothetical protein
MTVECTPQNFKALFTSGEYARLARYDRAIISAAMMGVRVLRARVPLDRGGLRRETKERMHPRAPGQSGLLVEIVEDQPYAAAQEVGTRPFWAPFAPLLAWATRQAPNLGLSGEPAIYAFARAVQKKIATRGITAKWHTLHALPELRRILGATLRQAATGTRDVVFGAA